MQKREIAKVVVNNMTGFIVGGASHNILRNHVSPSNNVAINLLIDTSVFVTAWFVSGTVCEPVRRHSDQQIDNIADALSGIKKS